MAKDLKTRVILETSTAEARLKALAKAINQVQKAVDKTSKNNSRLDKQIAKNVTTTNRLRVAADKVTKSVEKQAATQEKVTKAVERTNHAHKKSNSLVSNLTGKVKRLASAYLGVMALRAAITTSDTITAAKNKFNAINATNMGSGGFDENGQYTGAVKSTTAADMDKIYAASQRANAGYAEMMSNVAKSMTLAPSAFHDNIDNAIRFQEIMQKAYTVGGASAAEASSSMYQMVQALGSGILQGDELRSVREGAPLAYQAIEKFARGIYGAEENLKDLASQGKITSDIVVAAMMNAGDDIEQKFDASAKTFAQVWTKIKNTAIKAFEPVSEKLNEILNSKAGQAFVEGIQVAITLVGKLLTGLLTAIQFVFNLIGDNWEWLKGIIVSLSIIMLVYIGKVIGGLILMGAKAIAAGVKMAVGWLIGLGPIGWVIAGILIVIALFSMFTEEIVGSLYWLGNLFKYVGLWIANLAVAIWNSIVEIGQWFANIAIGVWTFITNVGKSIANFFIRLWSSIKWIGSAIATAFSNAWASAKAAAWDWFASTTEAIIKVANLINKVLGVFGLEIDISGFEQVASTARSNAEGLRAGKKEYGSISEAWNAAGGTFDVNWGGGFDTYDIDFGNAWSSGMSTNVVFPEGWGSSAYDRGAVAGAELNNAMFGWIDDGFGMLTDSINNMIDPNDDLLTSTGEYDPNKLLNDIADADDKTAGNTGKMADSMELAEEDLRLLYDLADREWKKEFTTASIRIDMTNNNSIAGDSDLDGLVTRLTNKLYEEMDAVATGVYSY